MSCVAELTDEDDRIKPVTFAPLSPDLDRYYLAEPVGDHEPRAVLDRALDIFDGTDRWGTWTIRQESTTLVGDGVGTYLEVLARETDRLQPGHARGVAVLPGNRVVDAIVVSAQSSDEDKGPRGGSCIDKFSIALLFAGYPGPGSFDAMRELPVQFGTGADLEAEPLGPEYFGPLCDAELEGEAFLFDGERGFYESGSLVENPFFDDRRALEEALGDEAPFWLLKSLAGLARTRAHFGEGRGGSPVVTEAFEVLDLQEVTPAVHGVNVHHQVVPR